MHDIIGANNWRSKQNCGAFTKSFYRKLIINCVRTLASSPKFLFQTKLIFDKMSGMCISINCMMHIFCIIITFVVVVDNKWQLCKVCTAQKRDDREFQKAFVNRLNIQKKNKRRCVQHRLYVYYGVASDEVKIVRTIRPQNTNRKIQFKSMCAEKFHLN